jgi:hypothetical protein
MEDRSARAKLAAVKSARYFKDYGYLCDFRAVGMLLSYTRYPGKHQIAEIAEQLGFLEDTVENEDGRIENVLLRKQGLERFARDWTALGYPDPSDPQAVVDAVKERRQKQREEERARKAALEAPAPWHKVKLDWTGQPRRLEVEPSEEVVSGMIVGVKAGVASPYDPDVEYDIVAAAVKSWSHPMGVYTQGPVLLVTSEDDLSPGMTAYAAGPREVAADGEQPVGMVTGTRTVQRRGTFYTVAFNADN